MEEVGRQPVDGQKPVSNEPYAQPVMAQPMQAQPYEQPQYVQGQPPSDQQPLMAQPVAAPYAQAQPYQQQYQQPGQPGQPMQPMQPGQPMMQPQPVVYVQNPTAAGPGSGGYPAHFPDHPCEVTCHECGKAGMTVIHETTGGLCWILFFICFITGLWLGCCCIPFCIPACND